jgi:ADP-ribose pyrophosphatase YjhB (NUDIX family)
MPLYAAILRSALAALLVGMSYLLYDAKSRHFGCAPYPPDALRRYNDLGRPLRTPDIAIDAIIRVYRRQQFQGVVLCQRARPPLLLCIPGGYVEYGESLENATRREVLEETNMHIPLSEASLISYFTDEMTIRNPADLHRDRTALRQFRTFSHPLRDKRRHTVSVVFEVRVDDQMPTAGDDAKSCAVFTPAQARNIASTQFAFDHGALIREYLHVRGL